MTETPERDRGLLGLVERLMRRPGDAEPRKAEPETDPDLRDGLDPILPEVAQPETLEPQLTIEGTRSLGRTELADVILRALQAIDGCPQKGFEVTVYGSRPWNAMLRITPAAGPLTDTKAWRARVQDMIPLLRDQYDLTDDDVAE